MDAQIADRINVLEIFEPENGNVRELQSFQNLQSHLMSHVWVEFFPSRSAFGGLHGTFVVRFEGLRTKEVESYNSGSDGPFFNDLILWLENGVGEAFHCR